MRDRSAEQPDGREHEQGSPVVVEVVYLRAEPAGDWHFRPVTGRLPEKIDPQQAARRIAGLDDPARGHTVLHSTIWRYHPAGHIVPTCAVAPDPDLSAPSAPLESLEIVRGARHGHPAPAAMDPAYVAAHAVRHLALPADTDPVVAPAIGKHPSPITGLAHRERGPAGQLT